MLCMFRWKRLGWEPPCLLWWSLLQCCCPPRSVICYCLECRDLICLLTSVKYWKVPSSMVYIDLCYIFSLLWYCASSHWTLVLQKMRIARTSCSCGKTAILMLTGSTFFVFWFKKLNIFYYFLQTLSLFANFSFKYSLILLYLHLIPLSV